VDDSSVIVIAFFIGEGNKSTLSLAFLKD